MTRRNDDEILPDDEHERAMPQPRLPDPGWKREGKPWYGDADRVSSFFTTGIFILAFGLVIYLVLLFCIWITGLVF